MPAVVARPHGDPTRRHRQDLLGPFQGLDLTLLIDAENDGPFGRRYIQANDIPDFLD